MSKSILDRVSIGSSCQTDWEAMNGDQHQRYCDQCEKSVHNLSQLTRSQAEGLIARTNGKLCARLERRPDGSILTADKSYSLPRFNHKFLRIASATMSAALSIAPMVAAKPTKSLPVLNFSQEQKDKTVPNDKEKTAKIWGIVYDPSQAVVANSKITLINESTRKERKTVSSVEGIYELASLEAGKYELTFESPGFKKMIFTGIKIEVGQELRQDKTLTTNVLLGDIVILEELKTEQIPEGLSLTLQEKKSKKNIFQKILTHFNKPKNN